MSKNSIKTGIIGFGLSGKVFHAPFVHTHPGFSLKKIVDPKSNGSESIYPYVEVVKDYRFLLEDRDLELIVVCTPNTTHYPIVKESLLAGKDVIVEKPFTPTSKEADELIKIAKKLGKKIFVYQNRRWDGDFLTIKKILKGQLLGELNEYEAHFDRYTPELSDNWRDENLPGGGILYDLGAHLIDQALHLFGKPDKVNACIEAQRKNSPVDDFFRLELEYPKLKVILTSGMMVNDIGPRYTLKGSKGYFLKYGIDPQEDALKKGLFPDSDNWGIEVTENWGEIDCQIENLHFKGRIETEAGDYMAFYNNVFEVIREGADMKVKVEEARDVIKIIEEAFDNAK